MSDSRARISPGTAVKSILPINSGRGRHQLRLARLFLNCPDDSRARLAFSKVSLKRPPASPGARPGIAAFGSRSL